MEPGSSIVVIGSSGGSATGPSDGSSSSRYIPPVSVPSSSSSSRGQEPLEENSHIVSTDENGDTVDETVRPEYSKTDPPPAPELPEGANTSDPTKPPEYEQSPGTPSAPQGGDKNENGEVPGLDGLKFTVVAHILLPFQMVELVK